MNSSSNQTSYLILAGKYPTVQLASGLAINSITSIVNGPSSAGLITDVLFRNNASSAVNINIILVPNGGTGGTSGTAYTGQYYLCQIQIPANAGSNGTTSLASLAALAPLLFDLDLAGNRVLLLESGDTMYIQNVAALAGILNVIVKQRTF